MALLQRDTHIGSVAAGYMSGQDVSRSLHHASMQMLVSPRLMLVSSGVGLVALLFSGINSCLLYKYGYQVYDSLVQRKLGSVSWMNWLNLVAYIVNTSVTYISMWGIFGATNTQMSDKYQLLVTPAGWAFSIWGPIFIWEGVFVVAQFLPRYRESTTVLQISPLWWAVCVLQSAWTLIFALDWVSFALLLMFCILMNLLGVAWITDGVPMAPWGPYACECLLLRAPFSLHLGWIIVASTVNVNLLADALKFSQARLLWLAVASFVALLATVTAFTLAVKRPDPIIGFVAAWAFGAIASKLRNPIGLNDPNRFNPSKWDVVTLGHLQKAASVLCILSAAMALIAVALWIYAARSSDAGKAEVPELQASRASLSPKEQQEEEDLARGASAAQFRREQLQDKIASDNGGGVRAMMEEQEARPFADADSWTQIGAKMKPAKHVTVSQHALPIEEEDTDENESVEV